MRKGLAGACDYYMAQPAKPLPAVSLQRLPGSRMVASGCIMGWCSNTKLCLHRSLASKVPSARLGFQPLPQVSAAGAADCQAHARSVHPEPAVGVRCSIKWICMHARFRAVWVGCCPVHAACHCMLQMASQRHVPLTVGHWTRWFNACVDADTGQAPPRLHGAVPAMIMQVQVLTVPAFEVVPRCCRATFLLRASILKAFLNIRRACFIKIGTYQRR